METWKNRGGITHFIGLSKIYTYRTNKIYIYINLYTQVQKSVIFAKAAYHSGTIRACSASSHSSHYCHPGCSFCTMLRSMWKLKMYLKPQEGDKSWWISFGKSLKRSGVERWSYSEPKSTGVAWSLSDLSEKWWRPAAFLDGVAPAFMLSDRLNRA